MTTPLDPNADDKQSIEAVAFDAPGAPFAATSSIETSYSPAQAALAVRSGAPWWHSQFNLMLCVFGLLAFAAFLFVVLAPPPSAQSLSNSVVTTDGAMQTAAPTLSEAPWDEIRRAQARTDSQDILAELLGVKKQLENKDVQTWAADRYQAALDSAQLGDDFYARQDFIEAIKGYRVAFDQMDSLKELIPDVLKNKIVQGNAAIAQGKSTLAKRIFNQALALDRNSIDVLKGLGRANNLDQALDLLNSAQIDEQSFTGSDELEDLQSAAQKYQQIVDLDGSLSQASDGVARVQDMIIDKQYRLTMSQGFAALFAGRNSSAKSMFSKSLKIRPTDAMATSAYRQSLASDRSSSLGSLLNSAKQFETQELWANAISNYQVALQRDPNQIGAKLGLIRSQARRGLDQRLLDAMSDPLSLSRSSQKQLAISALNDARAISKKGPLLERQIALLGSTIQQLDLTINVRFVSDQLTNVSLTKAGARSINLGKFASKDLALKPGRYVVSGVRLGFQDVRQEVDLMAGTSELLSVTIQCDQVIGVIVNPRNSNG
ncbi:MAG: tetratricopeptide (TPR) repeat protein [Cryomorphaceae bacterium]|jgi:tetratricopeptide (TPR) repeat protein